MSCIKPNRYYTGWALKTTRSGSVESCARQCKKTKNCVAFARHKNGKCRMRRKVSRIKYNKNYTSAYKSCLTSSTPTPTPAPTTTPAPNAPNVSWKDNWNIPRTLHKVMDDPYDSHCAMRGGGSLVIKNGIMTMTGEPRYYIKQKHKNVEFSAYFKLNGWKNNRPSSRSGFTLVTLSNHDSYAHNSCDARGYYLRLWANGELGFQQELKHDKKKSKTTYGNFWPNVRIWKNGIPKNKWIGLKFVVQRVGNKTYLKGYVDLTNGGGNWSLRIVKDASKMKGYDPCRGPKPIRSGNVSFIRTDRAKTVEVKNVRLKEISPGTSIQSMAFMPESRTNYIILLGIIIGILILAFVYRKILK